MSTAVVARKEPGRRVPGRRTKYLSMVAALALACLGVLTVPAAHAATYGPGKMTVAPTSIAAGSTSNTLTLKYVVPSATGVSGTVAVVIPTSGAPGTGFRPVPTTSNVSVLKGTCTSAVLAASNFAPVTVAYPGDSPGTRVSVIVKCLAGRYFALKYTGAAAPRTAQGYTLYTTVAGAPIATQPVLTVTPRTATNLRVYAPTATLAGVPFTVTVAARDQYGNIATTYRGTVAFTSTDPKARVLPARYTYTATDRGTHVFTGLTLVTDGARRITAKDITTPTITGTGDVTVKNAGAAVEGQVLSGMDPIWAEPTVTVYDAVTNAVLGSATLPFGAYEYHIGGLPAGPVKVGATARGFFPAFAGVVTLIAGQTLHQSFDPYVLYLDLRGTATSGPPSTARCSREWTRSSRTPP